YDEAISLLSARAKDAKAEFASVTEDLAFTRNQTITAEVNMSRVYNFDVKRKRDKKAIETAMAAK
ncbi:hypothetical protein TeGR_g14127, partial [Tetraparma gracilis]